MELRVTDTNEIEITGSVKNVQDYSHIKDAVEDKLKNGDTDINLVLLKTSSLTSSVISYLIKIVHSKNASVTLQIEEDRLINLLEQLNLTSTFKIVRI